MRQRRAETSKPPKGLCLRSQRLEPWTRLALLLGPKGHTCLLFMRWKLKGGTRFPELSLRLFLKCSICQWRKESYRLTEWFTQAQMAIVVLRSRLCLAAKIGRA